MFRAFTLIEILISLAILVISIYFISPVIFYMQDRMALNSEIENVRAFLYRIQTLSRYKKQSYSLTLSQNETEKTWCMIAIQKEPSSKKQIICDCLNIYTCPKNNPYFYYANSHKQIQLKNKSLYPNSFINIDGVTGSLESKCLYLALNQESEILQFNQWGRIYVIPKNKRSQCKY